MATFVLVHGAWHGGWCWLRVARLLRAAAMRESARTQGDGWRIPPLPPERFGVTSQRDREWLQRRLVPQPLKTFEQPLAGGGADRLKRMYVYCSSPAMGAFDQFAER